MKSIFEFRYDVYCVERAFLRADRYPGGRETDEFDKDSEHFCVFEQGEEPVGYVRLVHAHEGGFPFEQHGLAHEALGLPPAGEAVEISRLMVRKDYRHGHHDRRRIADEAFAPLLGQRRLSRSARILLHLYRKIYAYSLENGVRHWYAAMERSLARSLRQWGFGFRQIGPETDYFGPVAPYLASLAEMEAGIAAHNPALLHWLQAEPDEADPAMDWTLRHLQRPQAVYSEASRALTSA